MTGNNSSRRIGLSNTVLTKPWEKVMRGTSLLDNILHDHQQRNGTEADLVEDLFAMLGLTSEFTDTTDVEKMLEESKERICLPKFTLYTGPYATRTSTVILVSHDGHVTFVERDRFQSSGSPDGFTPLTYTKGEGRAFHFDIDLSAKQNKNEST
ncbi:hypothetical protein BCR43DRAFT_496692 [Syncephalastrum racemosum]|uniref:Uncharacterized protein n=1 Tax=Syncephalastrum racemosum TaxID=13706 RepID=A0A1X2H5R8_SYNRA|nr:hypothetical protein BCR43DRAFT_496692 [Syncephalastrum racemosum]